MHSDTPPDSPPKKWICADLNPSGRAYFYSFYKYIEMYKWSDRCVERIRELSCDVDNNGLELCHIFHRILVYYKSMERHIADTNVRIEAQKSSRLDAQSDDEFDNCNDSPASSEQRDRPHSLQIDEEEEMEIMGGEDEANEAMGEIVEGGEQIESGDEGTSSSSIEENTVVQPMENVNTQMNSIHRNEERMERESSPSLIVVRRVVPRIPPVKQCKIEMRDEREEEEEEMEASATATESSAQSTSHHETTHESMPSVASTLHEMPRLQIKQEVPENPFSSLLDVPPVRASTPPPLVIKTEPRTPTSAHSDHNYSALPSTEKQTNNCRVGVDASLSNPPFPPFPPFPSPPSLVPHPSPLPSSSTVPAVDQPSTSFGVIFSGTETTTHKMLSSQLTEISKQILHVNGIKLMALEKELELGRLSTPLHSICYDGSPLSMDKFNSECRRVLDEVRSLDSQFNTLLIPNEDYLRVSANTVREEVKRIWDRVKEQMGVRSEKKMKKHSTDSVQKRKSSQGMRTPTMKRKVSRITSKAKELAARNADRRRPDSILPAERVNSPKRRRIEERREERERRRSDEEQSTSRARRIDESDIRRVETRWCAFCKRNTSHTAINCSVFKTFNQRLARKNELGLCHHCLDVYDPPSCNRPEHKKSCNHCYKHATHPAFCKFLNEPRMTAPRSVDVTRTRKGAGSP